jgi:hypothetical protein
MGQGQADGEDGCRLQAGGDAANAALHRLGAIKVAKIKVPGLYEDGGVCGSS